MASDTAPAAVPDPAGPGTDSSPSGPTTGPLAGLLTPIEPARPTSATFNIDPTSTLPDTPSTTAGTLGNQGASSASYRTDENSTSTTGGTDQGILRAFALAAIDRWKKGGDARNKRLDIQKAHALAHRVKESRNVNRTENIAGGSTRTGSGNGKHSDSKTSKSGNTTGKGSHGASGGSSGFRSGRNNGSSSNGGHTGPSGRGGPAGSSGSSGQGGGSHTSGGKGGGRKNNGDGHGGGSSKQAAGHDSKNSGKQNNASGSGGSSGSSGTAGKDGPAGKSGAPGSAGSSGKTSNGSSRSSGTGSTSTAHCPPEGLALDKKPTSARKDADPQKNDASRTSDTPAPNGPGTPETPEAGGNGRGRRRISLKKTPKPPTDKPNTPTGDTPARAKTGKDQTPTTPVPAPAAGPQPNTQPSREAGYRDGARTATLGAHVKAYRDGFKDGHRDTTQAAEQEKQRLDKAHADRKAAREKDQKVTATSADYQTTQPQPVQVKEVTDTSVVLDGGRTFTRGEVRTLKQYERRMDEKAQAMNTAAEGTRQLQGHATAQAEQALHFLELSKTIEGGDKLTGLLTRLHDSATAQAGLAEELHKKVLKAAESAQILLTNVEVRYGGIYQAVCDSDLTKPAELAWYRK